MGAVDLGGARERRAQGSEESVWRGEEANEKSPLRNSRRLKCHFRDTKWGTFGRKSQAEKVKGGGGGEKNTAPRSGGNSAIKKTTLRVH